MRAFCARRKFISLRPATDSSIVDNGTEPRDCCLDALDQRSLICLGSRAAGFGARMRVTLGDGQWHAGIAGAGPFARKLRRAGLAHRAQPRSSTAPRLRAADRKTLLLGTALASTLLVATTLAPAPALASTALSRFRLTPSHMDPGLSFRSPASTPSRAPPTAPIPTPSIWRPQAREIMLTSTIGAS